MLELQWAADLSSVGSLAKFKETILLIHFYLFSLCHLCTRLTSILVVCIIRNSLSLQPMFIFQWSQTFCQAFLHLYVNRIFCMTFHDPIKMLIMHFNEYGWNVCRKALCVIMVPLLSVLECFFFLFWKPRVQFGSWLQISWLPWNDMMMIWTQWYLIMLTC